jgi:hypothetical protein
MQLRPSKTPVMTSLGISFLVFFLVFFLAFWSVILPSQVALAEESDANISAAPDHQWGQDANHSRAGLEVGFVQNGPRTGVELELDSKRAHAGWGPLLGIGLRTIDVEGHFFSDALGATEVHSAAFVFLALKTQNPTQSSFVYPYGVLKLGALLQGDLANAKAVGAGYVGLGAEFPYNELVRPLFSHSLVERSLSFFIEAGIAASQSRATKITGNPFVFNGIASTIGIKWYL